MKLKIFDGLNWSYDYNEQYFDDFKWENNKNEKFNLHLLIGETIIQSFYNIDNVYISNYIIEDSNGYEIKNVEKPDKIEEIQLNLSNIQTIVKQYVLLDIEIDYTQQIEIVKQIAILKTKAWIVKQLDYGMEFNGKIYNVSIEKQGLLSSQISLYMINKQIGIDIPLTWNSSGEICVEWSFEDLLTLSNSIAQYVAALVKKQQNSEIEIINCVSVDKIKEIMKDYE